MESADAKARALSTALGYLSTSRWTKRAPVWLSTLPVPEALTIVLYAAFVALLLTWRAIKHDVQHLERLGFRAAWIATTQTTLVFLLVARVANPVGLLVGASYERLNWLHRWAARVFFATVSVHAGFFLAEWLPAGFLWEELRTVAMVKWGFAAWLVLLWMVLSSLLPARRWRYEFFVAQHVVSAVALLALLFLHVPEHHHFSVWCAAAAFAYDVATRCLNLAWRNLRLRLPASSSALGGATPRYAYSASVDAVDGELTVVTIKNVAFKWRPGQHILVWSPSFTKQSSHPFTIAGAADVTERLQDIELTVKTKDGFTRALNSWAARMAETGQESNMRLLIAGPFGSAPNWRHFEHVVLIASSTGGSFTTPVLEEILMSQNPGCLRSVTSLYVVRRKTHATVYLKRISKLAYAAKGLGITVRVELAVTGSQRSITSSHVAGGSRERLMDDGLFAIEEEGDELDELSRSSAESSRTVSSTRSRDPLKEELGSPLTEDNAVDTHDIHESSGRPNIDSFLRREVGEAPGSVIVAVCAGDVVEGIVRRSVASIMSSRASSYSQDVVLHVERSNV
jgi:predicted ferric reductase